MKRILFNGISALVVLLGIASLRAEENPATLCDQAVSTNVAIAQAAQKTLRDMGPQGLDALREHFSKEIATHKTGFPGMDALAWKPIAVALDQVSGQYDDYASGLYWYTDPDKARAAATASGRPILSLRLLGRLDQNLSCANSRFFRTTLYPDAKVSQFLRDKFILHWESVRPVPVVTIDFGDGRKIVRTITGNSIHYVLDANGRPVDALPGLYRASTFLSELRKAADVVRENAKNPAASYEACQKATRQRLLDEWAADLAATGTTVPQPVTDAVAGDMQKLTTDAKWEAIARSHSDPAGFDFQTQTLMNTKFPKAMNAGLIAISKSRIESPVLDAFRNLSESIARDTVRNNYLLRSKILAYLSGTPDIPLSQVNDWVYASVFLTPKNDPWLGLAPADRFSGLDDGGVQNNADSEVFPGSRRDVLRQNVMQSSSYGYKN